VPSWIGTVGAILVALGFIILILQLFVGALPILGGGLAAIGFALVFLPDLIGSPEQPSADWLNARVAYRLGWAFTPVKRKERDTQGKSSGRAQREVVDPKAAAAYAALPELLNATQRKSRPLEPEAFFWGSLKSGREFWLGTMELQPMPRAMDRSDPQQSASAGREKTEPKSQSLHVTAIAGFPVSFDTGVRLLIQTTPWAAAGWRQIKTGAPGFDEQITVNLDERDASETAEARVLSLLTADVREILMDLARGYRARVLIQGTQLFVSGSRMSAGDSVVAHANCLANVVESFESLPNAVESVGLT
ncbi:MAG: hypothetical protein AAFY03_11330, partial [Pseudomonadota bacterium]